jgi:hypothetical protein
VNRLEELGPRAWDDLVDRLGLDVYLRSAYVDSTLLIEPGEPAYLHLPTEGGDGVFAAVIRGGLDVMTPYGYGGPVFCGALPPVAAFWDAYEDWCADRGLVASFFRFHPLERNHRQAPPSVRLECPGRTVAWPLRGDLLAGLHPTHRNKVRKAQRAGANVQIHEAPADLGGFADLYQLTMARLEAADAYRFPASYWDCLTELGSNLVLAEARADGEVAASALLFVGPRWLHYHLSATSDTGRRSGASNLLLHEAAHWGQERGLDTFHLGGGVGGREDGLFAFKEHFAPGHLAEAWFGKAIHDVPRYLELSGHSEVSYEGYFPAFRR